MEDNGYIMHEPTPEEIAAAMEISERQTKLANMPQEEHNVMFDSGAFNNICRGYMIAAMKAAGADPALIQAALSELTDCFDMMTSADALRTYDSFYTKWYK